MQNVDDRIDRQTQGRMTQRKRPDPDKADRVAQKGGHRLHRLNAGLQKKRDDIARQSIAPPNQVVQRLPDEQQSQRQKDHQAHNKRRNVSRFGGTYPQTDRAPIKNNAQYAESVENPLEPAPGAKLVHDVDQYRDADAYHPQTDTGHQQTRYIVQRMQPQGPEKGKLLVPKHAAVQKTEDAGAQTTKHQQHPAIPKRGRPRMPAPLQPPT